MANILTDDVQTYVRELIEKNFQSNRIEEKDQLKNRPYNAEEPRDGQHGPICNSPYVKE